ncbi:MAG TPA: hypothetical protein VF075_00625 [Pyrinomonadaceae bacterium]
MARKCRHHWDSFVNGRFDDDIEVETDNGGRLAGHHHRAIADIAFTGDCSEGPPHHMNLQTNENFEYDGDIHDLHGPQGRNYLIVIGTRTRFTIDKDGKRKKAKDDDVWVGVKTGT